MSVNFTMPNQAQRNAYPLKLIGQLVDNGNVGLNGIKVTARNTNATGVSPTPTTTRPNKGVDGWFELTPLQPDSELIVELEKTAKANGRKFALKGPASFTVAIEQESRNLGTFTYVAVGAQISGKVVREVDITDPTKDLPYADLEVSLLDQNGGLQGETLTDLRGEFSFPVVVDGVYQLRFPNEKSLGSERLRLSMSQPAAQFVSAQSGLDLRPTMRYTVAQSEIFGLIAAEGNGLDGVPVSLYDAETGVQIPLYDPRSAGAALSIKTTSSGQYRLERLRPGRFVLKFPPQFTDSTGNIWELEQKHQEQLLEIHYPGIFQALPVTYQREEHLIYGVATWSDGQEAANVTLVVSDAVGALPDQKVVTDDHGYYEYEVGRIGRFYIKADANQGQVFPVTVNSRAQRNVVITRPQGSTGGGGASLPSKFDELTAFPLLTESVGGPAAPQPSRSGGLATGSMGQLVEGAIQQVLGWKPRSDDPKGFVGALTQSFNPIAEEGAVRWEWKPRTYAVYTDLSGGITGAQASLYSRAQAALNESLPLLDGLTALKVDVDPENVEALRALVRSQMTELLAEFGTPGGPRTVRVDMLFVGLLGPDPNRTDADLVAGQLGQLREIMGMLSAQVNTVDEEQNLTNFRILVDYLSSLRRSWEDNRSFFSRTAANPFFGTQLVLLSRQLSVVAESVDELRSTLDSVFVGPAERQTLRIVLQTGSAVASGMNGSSPLPLPTTEMFLEELLEWAHAFASDEGPRIIQEGGKYGVESTFQPVVDALRDLIGAAKQPTNSDIPVGYKTARVQRAFDELASQLSELSNLAGKIHKTI